jgi:hypothetical protein
MSFSSLAKKAVIESKYYDYMKILQEGSKQNDPYCIYYLYKYYKNGCYGLKTDLSTATALLYKNIFLNKHQRSILFCYTQFDDTDGTLGEIFKDMHLNDHFARGYYFYGIGHYKEAIDQFKLYQENDDDDDEMFLYLGVSIYLLNNKEFCENSIKYFLKSAELGNISAMFYLLQNESSYENLTYWSVRYAFCFGDHTFITQNIGHRFMLGNEMECLTNLHLARCYFSGFHFNGENTSRVAEYLSWYFYNKTQDSEGVSELKELEKTFFKRLVNLKKITITLLCISNYYQKDILTLLAKTTWKFRINT